MLKDNFTFLIDTATSSVVLEDTFFNRIKGFVKSKFEVNSKDGIINSTKQGIVGSCWILSAINSLSYSKYGKKILSQALEYKNGYTIVHTICGDYVVLDYELNLAKLNPKYSQGDDDMCIFELAFEKILNDYANKRLKIINGTNYLIKRTLKKNPSSENKSSISSGHCGASFYFLTGIEPKVATSQARMLNYLNKFKNNSALVMCATSHANFKDRIKDINNKNVKLYANHAYSIKEFDGINITVVNPHNSNINITLSLDMFFNMFACIQMCDLSSSTKKDFFKPKMYYNKQGKLAKTFEISDDGYEINYKYSYSKNGTILSAKCLAQNKNGIYHVCEHDFKDKSTSIINGNNNTKIALSRSYKDNKIVSAHFGMIEDKLKPLENLNEIPILIAKQIQEYALYQYSNLDIEKTLLIASDLSNGNFESAFKYCK